jgi:hypothetical protein
MVGCLGKWPVLAQGKEENILSKGQMGGLAALISDFLNSIDPK